MLQLRELYMANNSIKSIVEYSFIRMANQERLDLSSNKLEFFYPSTFEGLKSLIMLKLSSNLIKQMRFVWLNMLLNLEVADFAKNPLIKIGEGSFICLSRVKNLYLNESFNLSHVEKRKFEVLTSLKQLFISKTVFDLNESSHYKVIRSDRKWSVFCGVSGFMIR